MKEKIRNSILYFSVVSCAILVIMMSINLITKNTMVELPTLKEFNEKLDIYKEETKEIKDDTCSDFINEFIDKIRSINYEGKVNFKDIYNINNSILSYYTIAKTKCNFTDEMLDDNYVSTMYLSSILPYEYINNEYSFMYEIKLTDSMSKEFKPDLFYTATTIKRNNELSIISKYIELAKEVYNEK